MSIASEFAPRYCVDDYLHWKGDWELWDGIAIAMTPSPFGRHQKVVTALATHFNMLIREAGRDATVFVELDWIVSNETVVRPDVVVVCGSGPEGHLKDVPEIAVEVLSPSTRSNDLRFKRNL